MEQESRKALMVVAELSVKHQHLLAEMRENLRRPKRFLELRNKAAKVAHSREELSRWVYEQAFKAAAKAEDSDALTNYERLTTEYAVHIPYEGYVEEQIREHNI